MNNTVSIIGDGISGLILGIALAHSGVSVTIISRPGHFQDSPLICPSLVINFLNAIDPKSLSRLLEKGARYLSITELVEMKFGPRGERKADDNLGFLFLSRKLLQEFLLEKAREFGIQFIDTEVTSLKKIGDKGFDLIFDCTGSPGQRRKWLKELNTFPDNITYRGPKEDLYFREYQRHTPAPLILRSGIGLRGGIYPLENNRFALSLSLSSGVIRTRGEIEVIAEEFTTYIGATRIMESTKPIGEWQVRPSLQSYSSDFYHSDSDRKNGFYPFGDGILFNNPIYGRGISLAVLQLEPLLRILRMGEDLDQEKIRGAMKRGYFLALKKWSEVSDEKDHYIYRWLKSRYLSLIESDPEAYKLTLKFYQLEVSYFRLIVGLIFLMLRKRKIIIALILLVPGGA